LSGEDQSTDKIRKYELFFINSFIFIIIFGIIAYRLIGYMVGDVSGIIIKRVFIDFVFFSIVIIIQYVKYFCIRKGISSIDKYYIQGRMLGLACVLFSLAYLNIGQWAYITIAFIVLLAGLNRGIKTGLILVSGSFILNLAFILSKIFITGQAPGFSAVQILNAIDLLYFYIILGLFALLCGKAHGEHSQSLVENKRLLAELGEKYEQLAVAQEEITFQYEKLKETNIKLEESNKKLASSIAEFYTLQEISRAISSILDINELLKYVNDIIIGVMGVNNSTIILYDETEKKLKVNATNIKNHDELTILNDNVNCSRLLDILDNGKPIIDNFVKPSEYFFVGEREINSLVCIPLSTKTRKFGLVLIEHKYYNAFDEENVRILNIIGQQVGIALENVELYQQMQYMATIDGLTKVYNRIYFHERLQNEFKRAESEGYKLSLTIFDIDYFKRYNDTYGHLFGDKVLKSVVEHVKNLLRSGDILARFGGEEFIVLFPNTDLDEAFERVERLRESVSKVRIIDHPIKASVTVSFGVASYPETSGSENDLLRDADDALYEAKAAGRNCVKMAKRRY